MGSGRRVGQRPDCHTFLCTFWHFQMAVSQWKLAWLTPNLGILWISVSSFWLCESKVANPIIYRLVPRPPRLKPGNDTRLLLGRIAFLTCGKSDTRHLIGLHRFANDNLLCGFWVCKSQYVYNNASYIILGAKTGKLPFYFQDVGKVCGRRFSWQFNCRTRKQSHITKKKNTTRCKTFTNFFSNQEWT